MFQAGILLDYLSSVAPDLCIGKNGVRFRSFFDVRCFQLLQGVVLVVKTGASRTNGPE